MTGVPHDPLRNSVTRPLPLVGLGESHTEAPVNKDASLCSRGGSHGREAGGPAPAGGHVHWGGWTGISGSHCTDLGPWILGGLLFLLQNVLLPQWGLISGLLLDPQPQVRV